MRTPYEIALEQIKAEQGLCPDQDALAHRILRDRQPCRRMPRLRLIAPPVDAGNAAAFPNIAAASEWVRGLSPERRDQLEREWRS